MDGALNPLLYFIASGHAFFAGGGLILLGVLVSLVPPFARRSLLRNLLVIIGGILVAISAVPLPLGLYALLAVLTVAWLISEEVSRVAGGWSRRALRLGVILLWLTAFSLELPYHFLPRLPELDRPTLWLIGDSVSAGMGEKRTGTWPALLAADQHIVVKDLSQMGATVTSARKQAREIDKGPGLVLLEIGGNDLLGRDPSAEAFAEGLERLLDDVCTPGRTVVMLELPLPPFHNAFGRAQRDAAARHGVLLVPRRVLLGVLTTDGATQDGVHLSTAGHAQMAAAIWQVIESAYGRAASAPAH